MSRSLLILLAAAVVLGAAAVVTHGALGAKYVAATFGASLLTIGLAALIAPFDSKRINPFTRYAVGGALRVALLLAVPIAMLRDATDAERLLVLYSCGFLFAMLIAEVCASTARQRGGAHEWTASTEAV